FFQAEDGIRDKLVTGVQTCALPISLLIPAAILLILSGPVQDADEDVARQTIELKKGDRVIFFGDSLTALAVKDRHVPTGKGYVQIGRAACRERVEDTAGDESLNGTA